MTDKRKFEAPTNGDFISEQDSKRAKQELKSEEKTSNGELKSVILCLSLGEDGVIKPISVCQSYRDMFYSLMNYTIPMAFDSGLSYLTLIASAHKNQLLVCGNCKEMECKDNVYYYGHYYGSPGVFCGKCVEIESKIIKVECMANDAKSRFSNPTGCEAKYKGLCERVVGLLECSTKYNLYELKMDYPKDIIPIENIESET